MEPFAYQQPRSGNQRRIGLVVLALASFGIWYFDLVPEVSSVSRGTLDVDVTDPQLEQDDFLALLEADGPPPTPESLPGDSGDDPLLSGLADFGPPPGHDSGELNVTETDSLADVFPEFGDQTEPPVVTEDVPPGIRQVDFESPAPTELTFPEPEPVVPAEIASGLRQADAWLQSGDTLEAHAALSRLYWTMPAHREFLYGRLQQTARDIYANPDRHFAEPHFVEFGQTLPQIAAQYQVPWTYLARLNGVTPETLQAGSRLKVLKGPFGAVVDLKRFELTIHAHGWYVHHFPIGLGKDGGTPLGAFTVQGKETNPTWYNPAGGRIDADDPANPLGEHWIGLGNQIGIHGTVDPAAIGRWNARGSIIMRNADVADVYHLLNTDSTVQILDR